MTTVSANEASEPLCIGCHLVIEEGSVIAFGDALFHLECFTCAKCAREVDCSSNLLLLNDGRPLCEQCSYICAACKQPTQHEAIMIGDEVYHAECFRCVSCKQVMSDLIFAQTSRVGNLFSSMLSSA
ncbi:uncharacterized protein BYT42DRAFT_42952 [Radiomyces spectabilis]|uniref:uncharacterized protein n=1 Tax=Radiomyces spectabilis TaxID=64574 RepID=UPI0022200673|nr:uncharacterized protein BYT42DRAFT_42952 [Radiomyces spectabilis]KAI8372709.1 hypothetical protein BYT42DRAFT_42952 [Radiomyces spectabilis]